MPVQARSAEERLLAHIAKVRPNAKGCILWPLSKNNSGYGQISSGSYSNGTRKMHLVHRIAWEIHNKRKAPKHLDVMHECDTRACVTSAHLVLGTRSKNIRDAVDRRRMPTLWKPGQLCPNGHSYDTVGFDIGTIKRQRNPYRECRACKAERLKRERPKDRARRRSTRVSRKAL